MRLALNPVQMTRWFSTAGNAWGFNMKDSISKINFGIFLIVAMTLQGCIDENPSQNESQRVAALIGLQVESAPVVGKTCRVMPSSLVTPEDFALRISQVSECTVQGNGSVFTDTAFPNPVEYRFGPSEPQSGEIPPMGASDNYLSQCRTERENYIRTVTPKAQYACWSNQYKNVVNLQVTTTSPRTSTRVCANFYDIGGSLRHSNDWACIDSGILTTDPNYTPINFSFGANGCPADQRSLPANISGISGGVRNATTEELSIFNRNAVLMGNCNPNDPNAPFIFYIGVPKELGRIGFRFYETHSGFMRTSVWDGGQFSSEKIVRFDLRVKSPFPTINAEMCRNARDEFVAQALPTMKVDVPNPTQNSAFCYSAPANANFELSTTDLAISQPEKECYHLENSPYYLCYPKLIEHSNQPRLVTRLQVTNTAISASSRCTSIAGSGLPAALVQDVCITETLIDPTENWAVGEPNDPAHDCVAMREDGFWDNRHCDEVKTFACQNTQNPENWVQTEFAGTWEQGFEACNKLPGGPYVFERPETAILLEHASETNTIQSASNFQIQAHIANSQSWINYHIVDGQDRWGEGEHFHKIPSPIQSHNGVRCAVLGTDSNWLLMPCDFTYTSGIPAAKSPGFVCRTNAGASNAPNVLITEAKGPWQNGFEACRRVNQGEYHFSKPRNSLENGGAAILLNRADSTSQFAWVNFSQVENLLMIPHAYHNFEIYPFNSTQRCAFTDGTGRWQPGACNDQHVFACRSKLNANLWALTSATGNFSQGFRACGSILNGEYEFYSPRSLEENAALATVVAQGGGQAWINSYLHSTTYPGDWEPASPYDFSENYVTKTALNSVFTNSRFSSLVNHVATNYQQAPVATTIKNPTSTPEPTYAFRYDGQQNLIEIIFSLSDQQKLLRDDVLYVLAQGLVEMTLGHIGDDSTCATAEGRFPRLLDDEFTGTPSDNCLLRETLAQMYMAYLMHGELSLKDLDGHFQNQFPMGKGRLGLLTGDIGSIDFTRHEFRNLASSNVVVKNARSRLSTFGAIAKKAGLLLEVVILRIEMLIAENNKLNELNMDPYSSTVYIENSKTKPEDVMQAVNESFGVCRDQCSYTLFDESNDIATNLGDASCHRIMRGPNTPDNHGTAVLEHEDCASKMEHILCQNSNGDLFIANNDAPNGLMLEDADQTCAASAGGAVAVDHVDDLGSTALSQLDSILQSLPIDSQLGLAKDFPRLCTVMRRSASNSLLFTQSDEVVACDVPARILCQNLDESSLKLTQGSYSLGMADEACLREFAPVMTETFNTDTDFYFAADVESYVSAVAISQDVIGTGIVIPEETRGRRLTHNNRKRAFDWSGDDIKKLVLPMQAVIKKARTETETKQPVLLHQLKTLSINVGQGSCHAVLCDARASGLGVESVLVDCGSTATPHENGNDFLNNIRFALGGLGAGVQLFWHGAFADTRPTVVISHPDKDHYNYLRGMITGMQLPVFTNLVGIEALYYGGGVNDYIVGNTSDLIKSLYVRGVKVNDRFQELSSGDPRPWSIANRTTIKTFPHCGNATLDALVVNHGNTSNEKSVVLQVAYDSYYTAILPGDALGTTEQRAMERMLLPEGFSKRLLIASHHGSFLEDSNSVPWRDQIGATHLIYSSGRHRGFLHPHNETFESYNALNSLEASPNHVMCTGRRDVPSFTPTPLLPTAQYSTYSSGTITSTVFIPQGVENAEPEHVLSVGHTGEASLAPCQL